MHNKVSVNSLLRRLWNHLSLRRKRQLGLLLILILVASFAELVSIGSVIPFLGALTSPERIFQSPYIRPVISIFGINSEDQIALVLTIVFCFFALLSGAIRLILLIITTRLSFAIGSDLGITIYQKTLYQPYRVHVARNSSEIINGISSKANGVIYSIILPMLTLISSSVILLGILIALVCLEPVVSILSFVIFGVIYILITKNTRRNKIKNSRIIAEQSTKIIKALQEGLGGIRDVLIEGLQKVYCDTFRHEEAPLRKAQASNQIAGQSPKFILESLGMVLIAGLAFYLFNQPDGISNAIPVLGLLALGSQRLLPLMQLAYSACSNIQGGYRSLEDIIHLLDQPIPSYFADTNTRKLFFNQSIELADVNFRYISKNPNIISNLNLLINKGDRVGIIGASGSGKSTLIDILMGLLEPTSGYVLVDGKVITGRRVRAWQMRVAHVPQSIFLADKTIAENIALGVDRKKVNWDRLHASVEKAQLKDVINNLPDGYNTLVGERGVRLSGGQRQRIGIARALYKNADVFVFDEATSALDNQTEDLVMHAISNLGQDITIIMVAHRLTTLRKCTKIIELADGKFIKSGSNQDIINKFKLI